MEIVQTITFEKEGLEKVPPCFAAGNRQNLSIGRKSDRAGRALGPVPEQERPPHRLILKPDFARDRGRCQVATVG
jgi:hypothetical protein